MKQRVKSRALRNVRKYFPKVKRVTDADTNAVVEVTSADVRASHKKDHNRCAMAVAAKREFKATGMVVAPTVAYVVKNKEAIRFALPQSVQKEIVSFDRGSGFAPGTYQLKRPPESNRMGARRYPQTPDRDHTNRRIRQFKHHTTGIRAVLGGRKRD